MNYYNEIKNELIDNEIYAKVKDYSKNRYQLKKYYNVGKLLVEAQGGEARAKYGDKLIKDYAIRLKQELGKGYTFTVLTRMRKFYLVSLKVATVSQLSWSHYVELLKFNDINIIKYYLNVAINKNLSVRELREKIKSNEYEQLDENARLKLTAKEEVSIKDNIKHPIIIENKYNTLDISEKMLKQLILNNIENFMKELGNGFCYIDKNIRKIGQDKTIGIVIAKRDNKFVVEYCK